mgnify:CR=1 FL=1
MSPSIAKYLPVDGGPLKMAPGLFPLSTDFGNGDIDHQFFQLDSQRHDYLKQKRQVPKSRYGVVTQTDRDLVAHHKALEWFWRTLNAEHPQLPTCDQSLDVSAQWDLASSLIQADIAVISAPPNDQIITTRISFPSGWSPERIIGQSFWGVHGLVPTFANRIANAESLAKAMCTKGPFVRFVWTVCGDNILDHHPQTQKPFWDGCSGGYLRVERHVTVPLGVCSVFLIRTYLYPLNELDEISRHILGTSLSKMPTSYAHYKGLTQLNPILSKRLIRASLD